jgi:hypothetical protein
MAQFAAVEIGDTNEILPDAPESDWTATCKSKMGTTQAGDQKITLEWVLTEDLLGVEGGEDAVNKHLFHTIVIRPKGHQWEKMFRQDVLAISKAFGLDAPRSYDELVAWTKELDGMQGVIRTKTDKKGDTRIQYPAKAGSDVVEDDEEAPEEPVKPVVKLGPNGKPLKKKTKVS